MSSSGARDLMKLWRSHSSCFSFSCGQISLRHVEGVSGQVAEVLSDGPDFYRINYATL